MKNYKKIIILSILLVAIAGFCLAPASAASKTVKINDNKWKYDEYLSPSPNSAGWYNEQYKKIGTKKYSLNVYQMTGKTGYKNIGFTVRSNKNFKKVVLYCKTSKNKIVKLTAKSKKENPIYIGFTSKYIASKTLKKNNNYSPYKYVIYY